MKKVLVAMAVLVVVLGGCGLLFGGGLPDGTFSNGSDTVTLEGNTFVYSYEYEGELIRQFEGEFDEIEEIDEFESHAQLTSVSSSTGDDCEVTSDTKQLKFVYYPSSDQLSFYLDTNGDGSFSLMGENVYALQLDLQE